MRCARAADARLAGRPGDPVLRHVQHALAREHGHESWEALKAAIAATPPRATPGESSPDIVSRFLTFACWDHHTHGKGDHRMHDRAAQRFLAQYPGSRAHNLYTAIVSGEIGEVRRILAGRPERGEGARRITRLDADPLCHLHRFTHPATLDHGLEIARLLLDHGANPKDFYMAGDSQYSALVGAAGEGEQDSPRQPYARPCTSCCSSAAQSRTTSRSSTTPTSRAT